MNATERFCDWACRVSGLLAVWWLAAGVAGAHSSPGKVLVADVIVHGNRQVSTQRILALVQTRPGREFSQETVANDVRKLYETRSFANVQVDTQTTPDGRVIVHFLVAELPSTVQEIIYHGANHIKPDELDTITGLKKGMPLNPVANQLARQAIIRRYHEKGRLFANVELLEGGQAGDTRVVFSITEGPVVRVHDIDIVTDTGDLFVSRARLKTLLQSSSAFLGVLGGQFNPMIADMDVAKLEEYYRSFGFHDVRVSRELQWSPDQRRVKLVFHVHEGQRYKVGSVDVVGMKSIDRDKLLSLVSLKPGENYNKDDTRSDVNTIKDWYGYHGRDVSVVERLTYKPGEVDVRYEIEERPPAIVGRIFIVGNEVTKQNVILRQIPLYPGQTLTYPNLRIAERNLARLNIFEVNPELGIRPTVTVLDPDSDNPVKDIQVQVQETHTGSLLFGVGVNSDAGLTGSIVLNERNFDILRPPTSLEDLLSGRAFRGAGQEFRIEAVPGTQLQRYTISFREPFLFDSPYSLGVSGYYFTRIFNEYTEQRLGGRITSSRRLTPYWNATAGIRLEDVNVSNVSIYAPFSIRESIGSNFVAGFRGGVSRDTRDSYLRPTTGSLLELAFEQGVGSYTFPVFSIEANKYWTVYERRDGSGRHVLAARTALGIAGSQTPVFERFYAGGFRSMRGFEFRGVGPNVNGFMTGGDFMFLNSLEYQLPILANDQLYAVAFVDSGTVEDSVEIRDYRVAAGLGLRIVVPMLGPVPIALDFGFPIVKKDTDREQLFSFWVGFFH
ncbi:MAG: outer membrane protein assembly factor BamA [Gemmataceae bacterium]|nr:outer membrane protein assembly factor BamA [Gemmataceae bacterium]MDW8265652.1 outer membrane protein assembly factor BamA [Gemmataceae bacterium]